MDRRRREVVHVAQITVRLSQEEKEQLHELADAKRIPAALLARHYIEDGIKRDRQPGEPERFGRDEEGGR